MSDVIDGSDALEDTVLAAGDQQMTEVQEAQPGTELTVADQAGGEPGRWAEPELTLDSVELLSRFLMGVLVMGGDELMQRLRYFQKEIETQKGVTSHNQNQETVSSRLTLTQNFKIVLRFLT